jgi:hypothetical protein
MFLTSFSIALAQNLSLLYNDAFRITVCNCYLYVLSLVEATHGLLKAVSISTASLCQDSAVSVATGYRAGRLRGQSSSLGRSKN